MSKSPVVLKRRIELSFCAGQYGGLLFYFADVTIQNRGVIITHRFSFIFVAVVAAEVCRGSQCFFV